MSLIFLILLAVLTWAVLAVPLAMVVGRLSQGHEREALGIPRERELIGR